MKVDKELGLSIFYIIFGSIFVFGGMRYPLGSLSDMGSGYFPVLVGSLLIIIGVLSYIKNFFNPTLVDIKLKVPLSIAALFVLSYIITKYIGFIAAITVLIWGSAMLHSGFNKRSILIVNIVSIVITIILKLTLLRNLPL
jgi:hypothetical protein